MLKYVCFWKLKEDASEEGHKLVQQYLGELGRRVGWVRSFSWGKAIGTGEAFDYGFTVEFDHKEGLEGYLSHPDRQIIEKRLAPYIEDRLAAYFDNTDQIWKQKKSMFRQITMMKVNDDSQPGKVDEVVEELTNLGINVPEVKRRHVVKITDNPDVDVLFMWEFENREAHQRYSRHPFHGPMDYRIRPFLGKSTGVRYEFEPE